MNDHNLKTPTPSEARENGKKGGIASGKARRAKKAMKETLEELLTMPIKDGKFDDIERIKSLASMKGKNISIQEAIMLAQIQKALKGDTNAARFVRDTMGQDPAQGGGIPEPNENDGLIDSIEEAAKLWQCD